MAAPRKREYDGRIDWTQAKVGDPKPCMHCGKPALLRHPQSGRACHKVCEDAQFPAVDVRPTGY